jgi:hypothetical protein
MLLTLVSVAKMLGVCEITARKIVRDLPAVRIGKRVRWNSDVIAEFAKSGTRNNAELNCK